MVDTIVMRRLTGRSRPKPASTQEAADSKGGNAMLRLLLLGATLFGVLRLTAQS